MTKPIVPQPPKPPGRPTAFHSLSSTNAPVVPHSPRVALPSDQSPSQNSSSGDEIPSSLQAIAAQVKALGNVVKVSDLESNQDSPALREINHQGWTCLAEVQLPDLPIWFEHQVRNVLQSPILLLSTLISPIKAARLELQRIQDASTA